MMRKILPLLMLVCLGGVLAAGEKERRYELQGQILQDDGKPFSRVFPVVFLHGAVTPFSAQALAGADGKFKFKNLPAGTYTLAASVPRTGEMRRTVGISPSLADNQGRVRVTLKFEPDTVKRKELSVSAVELSVPENARQEYQKAQRYLEKPDVERATASLKRAVEIAPQFAVAWNSLGVLAYQSRQFALAETYFREALKQDPESYYPLVNLGGALLSQHKDQESLAINQQAVKTRPDDPLAHSQLGQSYFYLGQLDDAERFLKQAKSLDPAHFSFPQLVLAQIYVRRQNVPEFISVVEEFLQLHPDAEQAPALRQMLEKARALPPRP